MTHSIRWRLVSSYVLLILLALGVMGSLALTLVERQAATQQRLTLVANAEAVANRAVGLLWPAPSRIGLQELAHTASFVGRSRVRIMDAGGLLLADSGPPSSGDEFVWIASPREELLLSGLLAEGTFQALPPGSSLTVVRRFDEMWGHRLSFEERAVQAVQAGALFVPIEPSTRAEPLPAAHVVAARIVRGNRTLGAVEVSLEKDWSGGALAAIRRAFLWAASGAIGIAVLVGLVVSRGLTAPLLGLTAAATRMSEGDLSARAEVSSGGEIGSLAAQFNGMAAALQASFQALAAERDALRAFVADASHELRTPLTALTTFNELLQGPAAEDSAARAEFLAESALQLDRLRWVTQNLLNLSRLDAGLVALEPADHDVGELLASTAAPFRPLAHEKNISLAICAPPLPLSLRGDRARLEVALTNLLDNALKFTLSGGQIEVGADAAEGALRLWVRDSGPGIPPDEQPRLFERFFRGRTSEGTVGSGLGLAIVQSVVQQHGGRVWVEGGPGAGNRFVIELPHD